MAGLLYRELVLNKKNLLGMALGEMAVTLLMFMPLIFEDEDIGLEPSVITALLSVFVFIVGFLVLGMMTAAIFEVDESKKWAYFITSTPLTDVSQIKEKYLFTLLLYVALFIWCYFLAVLSAALGGSANVMIAFMMMCIMLLTNAIEFPFIVRFGSKAGSHIKTAVMLIVMVIAFEYIFFGDLSIFGSFDKFWAFFERLSDTTLMSDIAIVLLAVFPYIAVGLYYLSYKISCKLYLKGAEEYER
ncbi:MAG: ABC-2 transporter permease [Oscillospiraceae bacterium]|nr:ABC-2 transporter permease [Oscillospiraceae bacterium]